MNRANSLNRKTTARVHHLRLCICGAGLTVCVMLWLGLCVNAQTVSTEAGPTASEANAGVSVQEESSAEASAIDVDRAGGEKKEKRKAGPLRRRAEVFEFVQEHFPELGKVLAQAEKNHPTKIKNAFSRINKEVLRLEQMKTARPEKFELAVKQWKLKTRIEIAIAQFAKKEDAEQLKSRIEPLVVEMAGNRRKMLELERANLVERLSKVDRLIQRHESRPDASVKFHLKTYEESASKIRNAKKKTKSIFQGAPPASDAEPSGAPAPNP